MTCRRSPGQTPGRVRPATDPPRSLRAAPPYHVPPLLPAKDSCGGFCKQKPAPRSGAVLGMVFPPPAGHRNLRCPPDLQELLVLHRGQVSQGAVKSASIVPV